MNDATQLHQLWSFVMWGFGLCTTGFFFLAGWMWWLVGRVRMKESLVEDVKTISNNIVEIKKALVGDFDKKGLITRVHEIEDKCEMRHAK